MDGYNPAQIVINLGLIEKEVNTIENTVILMGCTILIRFIKKSKMASGQLQNCIDKNRDLEGEQVRLEVGNKQAATTFQQFADHIQ